VLDFQETWIYHDIRVAVIYSCCDKMSDRQPTPDENPIRYCTSLSHHWDSQNALLCVWPSERMPNRGLDRLIHCSRGHVLQEHCEYWTRYKSGSWQTGKTQPFAFSLWICPVPRFSSLFKSSWPLHQASFTSLSKQTH